ncbi:MAG: hypothetical protein CL583_04810 [Alteromonadaceae bacterium]|nr:hypothetical protein [Alteromonadaceae bacterium]|tara:strand:+ start:1026 stop:2462 length:1437 start_codon:yes stop_codon:yes gene_type:complete
MKRFARVVFGCNLLLVTSSVFAVADDAMETMIKGFAEYQAGRVERSVLNGFLDHVVDDPSMRTLFPDLSGAISGYYEKNGQILLPLMQYYFEKDLDRLSSFRDCLNYYINNDVPEMVNVVKATRGLIENLGDGNSPDTMTDFMSKHCVARSIRDTGKEVIVYGSGGDENQDSASHKTSENGSLPDLGSQDAASREKSQSATMVSLQDRIRIALQKERPNIVSDGTYIDKKDIEKLVNALADIAYYEKKYPRHGDPENSADSGVRQPWRSHYVVYTHMTISLLKSFSLGDDAAIRMARFERGALFLASLTDAAAANDGSAVSATIDIFVREELAEASKRNLTSVYAYNSRTFGWCGSSCNDVLFLGSYFGLATDFDQVRAFGPVGIEVKVSSLHYGWNMSAVVAPIDVGAYVTNELKGEEYDPNVEDIIAPAYFISLYRRDGPLSFQLGYQKNIKNNLGEEDNRGFLAVSLDLPILKIY